MRICIFPKRIEMKINEETLILLERDLKWSAPFVKGQILNTENCWHFSTNGNDVDVVFFDKQDFIDGMNRIYIISRLYPVIILAFALMDNHIHFVLYGELDACNRFVHDYVKRTSMHIAKRHNIRHKMGSVNIDYQTVDDTHYLKTVICYCVKNPPVAGIRSNAYDYPWSSGALYFRETGVWTAPAWISGGYLKPVSEYLHTKDQKFDYFHTHDIIPDEIMMCDGMIFPGEYVAYEIVEKIFMTQKAYNYYMCKSKEDDVDLKHRNISYLSIPDQEMRQHRTEILQSSFGVKTIRALNVNQRLSLARNLKSKYNCSLKQIASLCGINFDDLKNIL